MVESTQTFILKEEKNIFILMKFAWLQAGDIFFTNYKFCHILYKDFNQFS